MRVDVSVERVSGDPHTAIRWKHALLRHERGDPAVEPVEHDLRVDVAVAIPLVRCPDPAGTLECRKRKDGDLDGRAVRGREALVCRLRVLVADD